MFATLQITSSNIIFLYEGCGILFQISMKYAPNGQINDQSAFLLHEWMARNMHQTIIGNNDGLVYIYVTQTWWISKT